MKLRIVCLVLLGHITGLLSFQAFGAAVLLQRPTATFSQTMSADFSVGRCLDGVVNDNLGWAIQGAIQNQTAAFQTVQDIGFAGGTLLTFSLVQNGNWWGWTETLGRFRISITMDDRGTFCDGLPTGGDVTANWTVLQPVSYASLNGASLTRLADNSILAGGTAPLTDTYTITAATTLTGITGIRLEVMQDPSLPSNGPGREPPNGNFILSEFQVSIAPAAPGCVPAPTNLVSWWRGEGSALDSWDHNKGELHGVTFAPGEVGQVFSFNGTSDYVHIPVAGNQPGAANLNVGLGDGLTLDAWVNPSDAGNGHPIIEWSQPVGGAPYGVHLWVGHPSHPPGYFYANIADTDGNWHVIDSDPGVLQANLFQHVAVTYNKTNGLARLYLNGAIVKESNLGVFTPQTSYELYFGERPPGDINSRYYAGLIDEIDVFSRALEPAEVQAIYNAGQLGKCVVNRPPVANDFRQQTFVPQPLTIHDATFISASSDPDEDAVTLDSVTPASANGGTVALNAGVVTYTPPAGFTGSDSFSYTISDGNGGTATASVLVLVEPNPLAAHMLPSAFVDGGFQLNFSGYPSAMYNLQRAESLTGPWIDLGSVTVDASGNGTLLDPNPPPGNAFYRAVYH